MQSPPSRDRQPTYGRAKRTLPPNPSLPPARVFRTLAVVIVPRSLRFVALALLVDGSAEAAAPPRPVFHFSASSTLFARPGVGRDGALYIGSGDGYVHALLPDGSFRWSYTVKGRVVAPPVEEPSSGRVF